MLVTLIRHGQIPGNIERRYIGQTDQHLTEEGRRQAAEADVPAVDRVVTSPLSRCRETADIMYPSLPKEIENDLREMDFGIFEGRSAQEMADFAPYREWVDGMCKGPVPDGESMDEFSERCMRAFERIVREGREDERIAFVVHGGTIMAIMGAFNDEGRQYFEFHLENCQHITCECALEPELSLHRIGGAVLDGTLPPKE